MDYKVINKAIAVTETVFDGVDERPWLRFCTAGLLSDIAAVLKCTLKPVFSQRLKHDRL